MIGAILAAWPAPALVISYELLLLIVRRSAVPAAAPDEHAVRVAVPQLARFAPAAAEDAARPALAASVAAANPLSERKVIERFGLSCAAERRVRQAVLAESNGHG